MRGARLTRDLWSRAAELVAATALADGQDGVVTVLEAKRSGGAGAVYRHEEIGVLVADLLVG